MNKKDLEKKYIELLLKRCLNFNNSKSLFIDYEIDNAEFVRNLVEEAKRIGVDDIYLRENNDTIKRDILMSSTKEEVVSNPYFNQSIWDQYALKNASFLILETEHPGLMDEVDADVLCAVKYVERTTKPIYKKKQISFEIPWCIAALPNKLWANKLFPNLIADDANDKLFELICKMCMADKDDPIESWNQFLKNQAKIVKVLNDLEITTMHYKNALGTDLSVELTPKTNFANAGSLGNNVIVNMPSYEIFSNPNFRKTNGIVYNSKPLFYEGKVVDNFFVEFRDGKVINYGAKKGYDVLRGIITSDEYSSYLGEVALINDDSPISNTNLVFETTLFDENASCHLAFGGGFGGCLEDGSKYSKQELIEIGVNPSKTHVDFMIGTSDLDIEAKTNRGKVLIFKKGNINL